MKRRVRRINKRGKYAIFLFSLLVLCFIGFLFFKESSSFKGKKEVSVKKEVKDVEQKSVDKISIVMVGDNLIHDKIYREAKTSDSYDFRKMYSLIKPIVQKYDVAYYNQETILGGSEIGVSSYPAFNSPYEVGDAMIDAGFNLVSLATNHTLDRGEKAVLNSRAYWNQKSDVLAVGSYASFEERGQIHIEKKNNITYTLLNYTYGTNGISVPNGHDYLVNIWPVNGSNPDADIKYQNYKEQVHKDIDMVRDKVDVLMVAMHWGIEYEYDPNSYQKDMASFLASEGVDIIIGTHPHVIQPIDWIGDTLVIYSLGNFISAHEVVNLGNRIGLMSSVDVEKVDNKIKLTHLENELLYTYYTSGYHDFLVVPFSEMKSEYLDNYEDIYTKYSDIVKKMNPNVLVTPIK